MVNFFNVLNIPYTDNEKIIKKAFYKKVKELHPDTGKYNDKEFNLLIEAYKTLIDSKKRREYLKSLEETSKTKKYKKIPKNRIIFPNNLANILKRVKILDKKRYREIKKDFKVDLYILLDREDIEKSIVFEIDLPLRKICPVCFGNDEYCHLCNGIGTIITSYKHSFIINPPFYNKEQRELSINKIKSGQFLVKKILIEILIK